MPNLHSGLIAILAVLVAWAAATRDGLADDRRVALVVGNSLYRSTSLVLPNPKNDAQDVAAVLRGLDFEVIELADAKKQDFDRTLANFARLASGADVALFYYAGHALQFRGRNYLMPIDAEVEDEVSLRYQMVSIDDVRDALERAGGVKIVILDACRNNPVIDTLRRKTAGSARAVETSRGLARIDGGQGLVVAFATAADQTALDGVGRNSPYTGALLKHLQEPGLEVEIMFRRVAADVNAQTSGRQRPETYVSLISEYYLNQRDRIVWNKIKSSDDSALLRDFINRFPSSANAFDARSRLRDLQDSAREKQLTGELEAKRIRDEAERKHLAALELERAQREAEQRRADEAARAEAARREEERRAYEAQARAKAAEAQAATQRELERHALAEAVNRQRVARELAPRKEADSRQQVARLDPDEPRQGACGREEEWLVRLRAAPTADEVARLERALTCEKLRPQVIRLRESVIAPGSNATSADSRASAPAYPQGSKDIARREPERSVENPAPPRETVGASTESSCSRDGERLAQLRATRSLVEITRFEGEMTCEKLRQQVLRLRESVEAR